MFFPSFFEINENNLRFLLTLMYALRILQAVIKTALITQRPESGHNKTDKKMKRNQEKHRVNVSDNIKAIANCIQENINGRTASVGLVEWCEKNQEKLQDSGFHTYNCSEGEVSFDPKLEDNFDTLLDTVESLNLR